MLLHVEGLHKRLGTTQALAGVTFDVDRGEVFGLLGPNGAGKTTTIRCLVGLAQPDEGAITFRFNGSALAPRAARAYLGLVPQEIALIPRLSVRENLGFFGRLYGLTGSRLARAAGRVLEIVGLAAYATRRVATLSGGMCRRLNLAVGLLHEPAMLLLDEPTVGVDPQSRARIFETIERLAAEGTTIIYTTHYMEEAQRLCRRVAIIDRGWILAIGSPADLIRSHAGTRSIRVRFAGPVRADAASALLADLPVESAEWHEGGLTVRTSRVEDTLPALLEAVRRSRLPLAALHTDEPTLESVFLDLTGRSLRDE